MLTPNPAAGYPTWAGYLGVFDEVLLAARVARGAGDEQEGVPVEGAGVRVVPLPTFQGVPAYLRRWPALRYAVHRAVTELRGPAADTAFIARIPGLVGTVLVSELRRQQVPFGLEVVGDVAEVLADHRLAAMLAGQLLARQCRDAAVVSYVTRHVLQSRYPARPGVPMVSCPGALLRDEDFVPEPRRAPDMWSMTGAGHPRPSQSRPVRLLTIGSQERVYKGHDVLVDAVALMRSRGIPLTVTIVGDGRHHDEIVHRAMARGLGESVRFVRWLASRAEVRAALDDADVFVLPSRTEGLPRVLVEAAARALPAVASAVGGVVEFLPPSDLVPPDDAGRLADTLSEMIASPERYSAASERNLAAAREHSSDRIRPAILSFHRTLWERTAGMAGTDSPAGSGAGHRDLAGPSVWSGQ
ncbi:glycosyltransferase family 4 protein [Frankia sp. Cpl3]|uniref:glycosyltransferase family 4 protein n=1 Tax=Parafrankia colletiae TaxID=573497 RepID=UPI00104280C4|nr:glycosyltransferase family 4 protein [Parafrankia colletiae]MCK9903262.1 glycosyltransferase family 4 protein [Frankia sp. Cpl3]